jgi:hypothetical protein
MYQGEVRLVAQSTDQVVAELEEQIDARIASLMNHLHLKAAEALFDQNDPDRALQFLTQREAVNRWPSHDLSLPIIDDYVQGVVHQLAQLLQQQADRLLVLAGVALEGRAEIMRDPERRSHLDPHVLEDEFTQTSRSSPTTALVYLTQRSQLLERRRQLLAIVGSA